MQEGERICHLSGNGASQSHRHRLKVPLGDILLKVAAKHGLHHDVVGVLDGEVFLEADHVRAPLASLLELNLLLNLLHFVRIERAVRDYLKGEIFVSEAVPC